MVLKGNIIGSWSDSIHQTFEEADSLTRFISPIFVQWYCIIGSNKSTISRLLNFASIGNACLMASLNGWSSANAQNIMALLSFECNRIVRL